jgi:hypothetical protein
MIDGDLDVGASLKDDIHMSPIGIMLPNLEKQTQAVFFNETLAATFLPALQIVWFPCLNTTWGTIWAKILLERKLEEYVRQNRRVRLVGFVELEGANHFVSTPIFYEPDTDVFVAPLGGAGEILGHHR